MKRALLLTAATLLVWVVAAGAMSLVSDGLFLPPTERPTLVTSGLAMLTALVPALLAVSLHNLAKSGAPEVELVSLLLGVGLRLVLTVAIAAVADRADLPTKAFAAVQRLGAGPVTGPTEVAEPGGAGPPAEAPKYRGASRFLVWVLFFYLAILALSTILMSVSPTRAQPPSLRPDDPGAPLSSHGA